MSQHTWSDMTLTLRVPDLPCCASFAKSNTVSERSNASRAAAIFCAATFYYLRIDHRGC